MLHWVFAVLLCIPVHAFARPSRTIPYFPQYNPWDIGIHDDESKWQPYGFPDETSPQLGQHFYSFDSSNKQLRDRSSIGDDVQPSVPVYEKGKGGFVPPNLSALDKVYWWDKRFNNLDIPPSEDLPYVDNNEEDADYEFNEQGKVVKKRDYTAAQLVNMLKALAKARRQRQIRIAGKSLRFGISR